MEVYIVPYVQLSTIVYTSVHFCTYFVPIWQILWTKSARNFMASREEDIKNKWILFLLYFVMPILFNFSVSVCVEMLSGMVNSVTFRSQHCRYL